jgi:hypothetical protein
MYTNDADFGPHEEDIVIDLFQPSRADLLYFSHGNFRPCSMDYNTYHFRLLGLFYEGGNSETFTHC